MTNRIRIFGLIILLSIAKLSLADGGMWIPLLLEQNNIKDMQRLGLKLSAEDIYSINQSSIKDAIVIFGRGCTGELISDEGLLVTNHHCGYGQIQQHSSVEHDYLTDGFWAMNREEELPNEGLTASFLVQIQDVTDIVLSDVNDDTEQEARQKSIQAQITEIQKSIADTSHYDSKIKPFYYGNKYYLFVYEVFKDVRLVGAPPSSIGKFGGDTDNWMWPRHTGDFSLFRIYADKNNKPAEYSKDNVPYKPKRSLAINIKGVKENDFTMVYGYPGTTEEYLTSDAVKFIIEERNPARIKLRDKKLEVMNASMMQSDKVRIQLASKYASVANGWKKWIGEKRGLERLDAVQKKQELERKFTQWVYADADRKAYYQDVLPGYKKVYQTINEASLAQEYVFESVFGVELIGFVNKMRALQSAKDEKLETTKQALINRAKKHFKDYDATTDQKLMAALFKIYYQDQSPENRPDFFKTIEKKYKGNFEKFAAAVYKKSVFVDEQKTIHFIENYSEKKLKKDMAYQVLKSALDFYLKNVHPVIVSVDKDKKVLDRKYMKGLLAFSEDQLLFPDANFTLRLTYGQVKGYEPKDGVKYHYATTLKGVMEKEKLGMHDYVVSPKLRQLYQKKDYGEYGVNGMMPVCFTGSNHTTGGNSGSPVLNAEGHLIGINFDRNWEGTMSDIMYDPDQCRNITLDIRYALFIIDKYAGARYLLDEMKIIK